jgi:hypothetical protein
MENVRRMSVRSMGQWMTATAILFAPFAAFAGQAVGTINVVNISAAWDGAFVQLNIPIGQHYESLCPNGNWAFIPRSDPFYASMIATLLAAKASGETVTVYTGGCVSAALGSQPKVTAIDYGTRMPGT